jgi:menaquinone-dependent protoporphyrinogen oxidase
MPSSVLIGYATQYGSTQEVAEAVAAALRECGLEANVQPAAKVRALEGYRAVVLGAPLYMSHWPKDASGFLSRQRDVLARLPVAVFALGPCMVGNEKEWQDARVQLDAELAKFPWLQPVSKILFGGRFDPVKLRFPYNKLLAKVPPMDLRDWKAIRAWAVDLAAKFQSVPS